MWDNMFKIGALNLGFLASLSFPLLLPFALPNILSLKIIITVIGVLWCFVYLAASALSLKRISDYSNFSFLDLLTNFAAAVPCGSVACVIFFIIIALLRFVIPFYILMGNWAGLLIASFVFWFFLMIPPALQFIFAAYARLNGNIAKKIKKCFIIFFDNSFFCVCVMLICIIFFAISSLTMFLFPGPVGIVLFLDEALRLRLLKYDWLESNPCVKNHKGLKIPWDELLEEERENTGSRTIRNFIFPWKD